MEQLLEHKMNVILKMMQSIAQLQESKNVSHHLYQIQSKPLDLASLPLLPMRHNLKFIFLLSIIVAIMFAYSFYFVRSAFNGFYVSLASLEASSQVICGTVSFSCDKEGADLPDKDLETLRRISSRVLENKKTKVVTLIGNGGPNYSSYLAALFGKIEKKVVLVDCDFNLFSSEDSDREGFLKYLKKKIKEPTIINKKDYDYMRAGGYTRYSAEVMASEGFAKLIDGMSQDYDYVILYTPASLKLSDARVLLNFSNMAIVTIKDETMKDIKSYLEWKDDNYCRFLSFIAIS